MKVPLLDLRAQYARIRDEVDAAIGAVVEQQSFILGPEVEALEREIADYCGASHAVGCASGSDALLLAFMAAGVGPGDQVLCPAYTFFSTAGSVARLGGEPVFADVDPATYTLCPDSAAAQAERCTRLKAIVPVHLYGRAVDLDAILDLAERLGVPVIEDAAQAIGARDARGLRVGTRGRLGCFSFFPSKNLGAYGDAGLLTTQDGALADRLRMLRVHGSRRRYFHDMVGANSRLDALQAAVLRVKLRHVERWSGERSRNAAHYDAAFAAAGAAPSGVPFDAGGIPLRTPRPPAPPATHIYHQYVIRVPAERREALQAHLAEAGIGTAIYYPLGLHMQSCFAGGRVGEGDLPHTEAAARETLALPIYPELEESQLEYVVEHVLSGL